MGLLFIRCNEKSRKCLKAKAGNTVFYSTQQIQIAYWFFLKVGKHPAAFANMQYHNDLKYTSANVPFMCKSCVYMYDTLIISPTMISVPSALKHTSENPLSLMSVFSHLPPSYSLCHFLSFILSLTQTNGTNAIKLQYKTRDMHGSFLSLLLTFYWLWPQSVLLPPCFPICSSLLLIL